MVGSRHGARSTDAASPSPRLIRAAYAAHGTPEKNGRPSGATPVLSLSTGDSRARSRGPPHRHAHGESGMTSAARGRGELEDDRGPTPPSPEAARTDDGGMEGGCDSCSNRTPRGPAAGGMKREAGMNPGDIEIVPGGPMEELEFDIAAGSVGARGSQRLHRGCRRPLRGAPAPRSGGRQPGLPGDGAAGRGRYGEALGGGRRAAGTSPSGQV